MKRPARPSAAAAAKAAVLALAGCSLLLLSSNSPGSDGSHVGAASNTPSLRLLGAQKEKEEGEKEEELAHRPFRRIYVCRLPFSYVRMLFPEFDGKIVQVAKGPYEKGLTPGPSTDDLLLAKHDSWMNVQCGRYLPGLDGEVLDFPGKMMFISTECADTQGGPRPQGNMLGPPAGPPVDEACSPGVSCLRMQGTVASQVPEFEKVGNRFNYLPPSDRAYFFGAHPDSDRSIQLPLVTQMYMKWGWNSFGGFDLIRDSAQKPHNTGEHFAVFLSSHCVPWRDEAAKRIAQLGKVHVGESWMEQCAGQIPDPKEGPKPDLSVEEQRSGRGHMWANNDIMSHYKFALVMENTYREGYITEKMFNAFRSGAVPIWYGGKNVAMDIFNPEAFVFYDVEDPQPALDRIKFLKDHPKEYNKVLKAPILKDGERTVEKWFSMDDRIGGGKLKNRIRRLIGVDTEGEEAKVEAKTA